MTSQEMTNSRKPLTVFLVVVIVLSLTVEAYIISGGPGWLYFILMWIPALSAVITGMISLSETKEKLSARGLFSCLHIRKSKVRYILMGILIPLVYLLIPYMIYWKTHPDNFGYTGVPLGLILKDCLPMMIIGIFPNVLSAMGEEIGWRGFLLPAFSKRMSLMKALIVTGLFWACWHLPLLAFGDYMEGAPIWYKLPMFVLCIVPVGIIAGFLTYKSKSIWPAAFLHAAHNNFDQAVFGVITRGDDRMYYVSETGLFTVICAWLIAAVVLYIIKRDKEAHEKRN